MKEGWEIKMLGEVCDSINGLWKGKKEPFVKVGVIRSADFTKGCTLDYSDISILDVEERAFAKRKLQVGDLIIERSGGSDKQPVGRAMLFEREEGDFSFSNFTSVLRIKDQSLVAPKYLWTFLLHVYRSGETRKMQSNAIGLHNLDFDRYKRIAVPLPPLPEQRRIVEVLDREFERIGTIRRNAETSLKYAKDLMQAKLKEELEQKDGWELETLKNVGKWERGRSKHRPRNDSKLFGGKYPFIQTGDITAAEKYITRHTQTLSEFGMQQSRLFSKDTLCITIAANIGAVAILSYDCCFPDSIVGYTPNARCDVNFMYYYLCNKQKTLEEKAPASAQKNLNLQLLVEEYISLPSIAEQQQIVARLDKYSETCKKIEENSKEIIAHCDALKQALLRKAFDGKL